jgi:hypothetical protein
MLKIVRRFYDAMCVLMGTEQSEIGADTVSIALVNSPFTPGIGLVSGDYSIANFETSGILEPSTDAVNYYDAETDQNFTRLVPPAGGWNWRTTSTVNLPQTIYGYVVRNGAGELIGSDLLPEPMLLTRAGESITLGDIVLPYSKSGFGVDPLA